MALFSVSIRLTPVTKKEIDNYMLFKKGDPQEIISYLRSIIQQYVDAKEAKGCIDVPLDDAWANLKKILVDDGEKKNG